MPVTLERPVPAADGGSRPAEAKPLPEDQPSLYYDDIVTWSEGQAAALRALAERPELSNALDWENVVDEIESVARSEFQRVESALELVLSHLLKYLSAPSSNPKRGWESEVATFQVIARRSYRRSMQQRIDWDDVWAMSMRMAQRDLARFGDQLVRGLPETMPFAPEKLVSRDFSMDAALAHLADMLAKLDQQD